MKCQWQVVEGYSLPKFRCSVCHLNIVITEGDPAEWLAKMPDCRGRPEATGPAFRMKGRIRRYVSATKRWIKAGRPVRSPEEVQTIFDLFCQPCEHFCQEHGVCNLCGCRIRRKGRLAMTNKLKMASEHCGLDKW